MAGYSGTPLVKKLGIKSGMNVRFVNDPPLFKRTLDLPPVLTINQASRKPLDFVLLFAKSEKELAKALLQLATKLKPSACCGWHGRRRVQAYPQILHSTTFRPSDSPRALST